MSKAKQRVRRSEKLTPDELTAFKAKAEEFDTKIDAADFFGFSTVTLDNVSLKGSGKPATIRTIREKLQLVAA